MQLKNLVHQAHIFVEATQGRHITRGEMALRLGISRRTYTEYIRGVNSPIGMRALLDLLSQLNEREQVELLRRWKSAHMVESKKQALDGPLENTEK